MAHTIARIRPKQSLGQNFLIDDNIARNIVRDLQLHDDDIVLEIGPGQGALTRHLAERAGHLIAVELDQRVIEELQQQFTSEKVTIVHGDFLQVDLCELHAKFGQKLRVVGNVPYHLTSPIIFKVFEEHGHVRDLTIMVQKEVADRISASPSTKAYGILSVMSRFHGEPKQLFTVSPNCFYPKPKVTSSVIRMRLHESLPLSTDAALLSTVVRTTFGKRRKTLRNGLQYLPMEEEMIRKIVAECPYSLERRPEELTVDDFITLTHYIQQAIA